MSSSSRKLEQKLDYVEEIVMRWANQRSMIWDGQVEDVNDYIEAVWELPSLRQAPWTDRAQFDRVLRCLATATARLTEEFRCILITNSEAVDGDWLTVCKKGPGYANEEDPSEVGSDASDDEIEDEDEDIPVAHPVNEFEASFDPVPPERVKDLNVIVKCMTRIGAMEECMQAYVSVRKSVLEQSLYRVGLERTSPELLQKMDLEAKIRKWIQAVKVSVKVIFPAEKRLCKKVFGGSSREAEGCFAEVASGPFMEFLAFCKTVAMANRTPEKLFKVLEMHELLEEMKEDIFAIYESEEVREEVKEAVKELGVAIRGILQEMEVLIQMDSTKKPVPGAAHHPLTRYVMNYARLLIDYASPLQRLLHGSRREAPSRSSGFDAIPDRSSHGSQHSSPLAVQIMWLVAHLETNLINNKSQLYRDPGFSFLFLMNNTNYIVQKVKQTELGPLLGDAWIQKHSQQINVYADSYIKAAWQNVVSWLTDMISLSKARSSTTLTIKDRLKNFNGTFDEVCRTQKNASVPDPQLREQLRLMIAQSLLPSYRTFVDTCGNFLDTGRQRDKFLKYTADDLENCLIDLFDPPPSSS